MGKKSAPQAPDPYQVANAQSQANIDALLNSANLNRFSIDTPLGNIVWDRPERDPFVFDPSGVPNNTMAEKIHYQENYDKALAEAQAEYDAQGLGGWTQRVDLSPAVERQLEQQNELAQILGGHANRLSSQLPVGGFNLDSVPELSTDFSGDAARVEQATFDRAMQLMNPQFDLREKRLQTQLANQGLPMGGEAYNAELDRFDRSRNEAQLAAALDAVGAGRQEHSRMFGINQAARQQGISDLLLERTQPYNELSAILQGKPALQMPQVPQTAQYQMAPTDIAGLVGGNYANQMANYNAKKQGTTGLLGNLGSAYLLGGF